MYHSPVHLARHEPQGLPVIFNARGVSGTIDQLSPALCRIPAGCEIPPKPEIGLTTTPACGQLPHAATSRKCSRMNRLDFVDQASLRDDIPAFNPGDTINVHVKVIEGAKERIKVFK